jgi:hypothetical protein
MSGSLGTAKHRVSSAGLIEAWVQLEPFESCILHTYSAPVKGSQYTYLLKDGAPVPISDWSIEFVSGGPVLPAKKTLTGLGSWTDIDQDAAKNFSGTAKYTAKFNKPSTSNTSYLLDLGVVKETAEVFINGKRLGGLIGPGYKLVIPAASLNENNTIEVLVSNLMANRITYMDKNAIPWKTFYNINMPARRGENSKNGLFDASKWNPLPSGLLGPVTLAALK